MLSECHRTILVDWQKHGEIEDIVTDDGVVMTDGCAGISPEYMELVAAELRTALSHRHLVTSKTLTRVALPPPTHTHTHTHARARAHILNMGRCRHRRESNPSDPLQASKLSPFMLTCAISI